jgi:NAD(P)-dependent dehydrogenase (short-subunit alcohol dehydrogenase family)
MMKDWQRRAGRHLFGAMTVEGQSLVIIGGSSGMGLAIAKKAVQAGANVTIAAFSRAKLDEAREAIAADVTTHTVDVSEEQSVKTLFSKIGPFDHLVVPGSSVRSGPLREFSLADARASMDSKFWGQYLAARYAQIRSRGSITLFSGILSRRSSAGLASLASINAAVEALGRALAVELAPIRVNVISPGITDTPADAGMPERPAHGDACSCGKTYPSGTRWPPGRYRFARPRTHVQQLYDRNRSRC